MHLIMGNYLVKSFFIILSKKCSSQEYAVHSSIILEINKKREWCTVITIHKLIKQDYNHFMLDKFILMQCRNYKIMGLIMINKDIISMSNGHSFSTDPMLSIINILSTT